MNATVNYPTETDSNSTLVNSTTLSSPVNVNNSQP